MRDMEAVFPRDASWHRRGRGGSAYAYHWPSEDDPAMARCQPRFTMLSDDMPEDPAKVPESARCGRPGCRQQWARWAQAA